MRKSLLPLVSLALSASTAIAACAGNAAKPQVASGPSPSASATPEPAASEDVVTDVPDVPVVADGGTRFVLDAAAPEGTNARVLLGTLDEGDPTSAAIAKTMRDEVNKLRACYAQGLASKPGIHGKLRLKFTVEGDGHVSKTEDVGGSFRDADTIGCMMQVIGRIKFPKPAGSSASVTYPFILRR